MLIIALFCGNDLALEAIMAFKKVIVKVQL